MVVNVVEIYALSWLLDPLVGNLNDGLSDRLLKHRLTAFLFLFYHKKSQKAR
jgi:hypothetical protein